MPIFQVTASDGATYEVDAVAGTSREELLARIEAYENIGRGDTAQEEYTAQLDKELKEAQAAAAKEAAEAEEGSLFGDILQSPVAGAVDLLESAALGAIAPLGEGAETSARDIVKSVADFVRPEISNPDNVVVQVGKGLGSLGALLPAAFLGPAALPAIAGISMAAGAGEASERARTAGASVEDRGTAALKGVIPGAFDVIPAGRLAKLAGIDIGDVPIIGDMLNKLGPQVVEGAKDRVQRALISGGIEGGQEAAQNIAQNLIEQGYNPDAATFGGTLEEGLLGGSVGTIAQGLIDLVVGGRRGPSAPTIPAAPTAPTQGELFPETDLGVSSRVQAAPGELFAGENLGRAPEEDTQLNLFEPVGSPEAALEGRREPEVTPVPEGEQLSLDIEGAILDRKERELLESSPVEDTAAEIRRAVTETEATTPMAIAAQEALARRDTDPTRIAEEEARITEQKRIEEQTQAEIAGYENILAPTEAALETEVSPEVIPTQASLPDMGKSYAQTLRDRKRSTVIPTDERPAEPRILDEEVLNKLEIAATAPIRKRVLGKDFNEPEVRQELATFAGRPKTPAKVKSSINKILSAAPDEQTDIWGIRNAKRGPSGRTPGGGVSMAAKSDGQAAGTGDAGPVGGTVGGVRTTPETLEDSATPTVVDIESVTPSDDAGEGGSASPLEEAVAKVEAGMPTAAQGTTGTEDSNAALAAIGTQLGLNFDDTSTTAQGPAASAEEDVESEPKTIKAKSKGRAASAKGAVLKPTPRQLGVARRADIKAIYERGTTEKAARTRAKTADRAKRIEAINATPVINASTNSVGISDYVLNNEDKDVVTLTKEQLQKVDPAVDPASPLGQRLTVTGVIPVTEESLKQETAKKRRTKGQNEKLKAYTEAWDNTASSNLKVFVELAGVRSYMHARLGATLQRNPDPLTEEDIQKVLGILEGAKGDPKLFFSRSPDPVNGLVEIAYALTGGKKTNLGGMTAIEREYFQGLNSESAGRALSWAKSNLSEGAYNWAISYNADIVGRPSVEQAIKTAPEDTKYLAADAVAAVDIEAHPMMGAALRQGDIKSALRIIATTTANKRLANIATRLGNKLGDTKIEIVENLVDEVGVPMAGRFVPTTNTIQINPATGFNIHTVLHETTHALTSATLANKSHPTTKKLQKLFDEIQDSIGNVYGSRNLDEFVAETFGNHEFQRLLGGINPKGGIVTALQRFANIITNFIRSNILRVPTKAFKPDSVLDKTDKLVNAILAPAPQYRDAGAMNLDAASVINRMGEFAKGIGKPNMAKKKAFLQSVGDFYENAGVDAKSKKLVAYIAPLQALGDMAKRYGINAAYKLEIAIRNMVGAQGKSDTALDATSTNMTNWLKGKSDPVKKAFNNLVYTSTRSQVDPYAAKDKEFNDATAASNKANAALASLTNKKGTTAQYNDLLSQATKNKKAADSKLKIASDQKEEKAKVWEDMRKDVKAVDEGGKEIYTELRNVYAKQIKQLEEVLNQRIDNMKDAEGNPLKKEAKEQLRSSIFDKIFAQNRIEPYFPLTREGEFWVKFVGIDPVTGTPEPVYMAFKRPSQRKKFVRNLKAEGVTNIQQYSSRNEMVDKARDHTASTSFVGQTLKLLNDANVSKEVEAEFLQIFLHTMPESSFAKQLIRRGNEGAGELGFVEDAEQAFRQRAYDMGAQIARMDHSSRIDAVMLEIEGEFKALQENTSEDQTSAQIFTEELRARAKFAKNPPNDMANKLAAQANRVAFIGTIGFNASSAIVNATQIPLMMYPILIGKYGIGPATKAMGRSMGLIKGSGTTRMLTNLVGDNTVKARGTPSIDNYFQEDANGNLSIRANKKKGLDEDQLKELKDLQVLVELANNQGQLNRSLFYDTLGVEMSGRAKDVWDKTNAYSAFMFHQVERFNRQVAMTTVYKLELDRLREMEKKKAENLRTPDAELQAAAAKEALYKAQEMNGGAFLATAPRVAQTHIGRVAMMYKTFGLQMYYTILKTGKIAFSDADPDVKREAQKQLAGIVFASVAMSGVQGIPMIGALMLAWNLTRDDDEEDAETILRQYIGEGWYKGGINALTGVDVANRIGMGNLLFRLNPYAQNQSPEEIAMQAVGGPAWSVGSQLYRGLKDMADGELQRGIENTLPAAFRNVAKMVRYSGFDEGGINTRKGNPIYDDVTTGELLFQFFGFAPTGYTLAMDINRSIKEVERGTVLRRKKALDELYMSIAMGSGEDVDDAIKEVIEYNDKHPNWVISGKTIIKSMNMRYKTAALMHNGVTVNPSLRADLLSHSNDYWGSNDYNLVKLLDF